MTEDELDELVLKKFQASDIPMRYSDVAGEIKNGAVIGFEEHPYLTRARIEASVDRLAETGFLKDVTKPMDWHPHWVASNPLDLLAKIAPGRKRRRRQR